MYNNNIFKNSSAVGLWARQERGVSLIATFFILTIILAIVLNISILLYGEIKIIRNIGNSVVAFYAADSGVEKTLYYNRKELPVVGEITGERGLCNINNICPDCNPGDCQEANCQGWEFISGSDCDPLTCTDCKISFNSFFDGKSYAVVAEAKIVEEVVKTTIKSTGIFKNVSRRIELQYENDLAVDKCVGTISIDSASATPYCVEYNKDVYISAEISSTNPIDTVKVIIRNPDIGFTSESFDLSHIIDKTWKGYWTGPAGTYYADIQACDTGSPVCCANYTIETFDACP